MVRADARAGEVVTVVEVLLEMQGSTAVEGEVGVEVMEMREVARMGGKLDHHVEAAAVERDREKGRTALAFEGQEIPNAAPRTEDVGRAGGGQRSQFQIVLQFGAWKPFVEERRGAHL